MSQNLCGGESLLHLHYSGDLIKKGEGYIVAVRRDPNPLFGLGHKIEQNWELDRDITRLSDTPVCNLAEHDKSTCLFWQFSSYLFFSNRLHKIFINLWAAGRVKKKVVIWEGGGVISFFIFCVCNKPKRYQTLSYKIQECEIIIILDRDLGPNSRNTSNRQLIILPIAAD